MLDLTIPPTRPLVAASILSADFGQMAVECRDVLAKGADLLHVDVMDGHFVPNLTMGQDMIRALRKHLPDIYLDVHLMVEQPDQYIDTFAAAGASLFSFHVELCEPLRPGGLDAATLIDRIHAAGMDAGMVVNPPTPLQDALRVIGPVLERLQLVLVMSVRPGRSGQSFIADVLPKARGLKDRLSPTTRLEMDGGISPANARQVTASGVDVIVTASALFGADDRAAVIQQLHAAGLSD